MKLIIDLCSLGVKFIKNNVKNANVEKPLPAPSVEERATKSELRKSKMLTFRLWFNALSFLHLVIVALVLVSIDYDSYEDPRIKEYEYTRFKLLTVWLNILQLVYFPLAFVCDLLESQGRQEEGGARKLNNIRHFLFTAILFPSTLYVDAFFWRIWTLDRELIVPSYADVIIPIWCQHSLHNVSWIVVLVDLFSVPRLRPKSLFYHSLTTGLFVAAYLSVTVGALVLDGLWLYPFLERMTYLQHLCFSLSVFVEHFLFSSLQWCLIGLLWSGDKLDLNTIK